MLFQRALKGVGEVKKKEGGEEERKEWEGRRAEGREGGICAIGVREDGRPCAETQINRQEDHFHCTSLYPRVPKVGGQFSLYPLYPPGPKSGGTVSPHTRRLRRPCTH